MLIEDFIDENKYVDVMELINECLEIMGIDRPNNFMLVKLNKFIISYYLYMAVDEARKVDNLIVLNKLKNAGLIK